MNDTLATEPNGGLTKELQIVSRFGGQIALSQLVQYLIVLTDIMMMARLDGPSLAAGLLINSVYVVIYVTSFGLLQGMMPMASRAAATEDNATFSDAVFSGLRISVAASLILSVVIISFVVLLEPLGYDAMFSHQCFAYVAYILPGYVLSILLIGLRNILIALGRTHLFGVITFLSALLNAVLNAVFAFGALGGPNIGLAGIGLATTVVDLSLFAIFSFLVVQAIRSRSVPGARPLRKPIRAVLRIGVPTAAIFFIETSMFSGVLFVVGRNDAEFLVVLGLIFQYETMAMMIPIGMSQATVQRVSIAIASGSVAAARLLTVTWASLLVVAVYLTILALVQFAFQINPSRLLVVGAPLEVTLLIDLDKTQLYAFAIIFFHAFIIVIASVLRGLEDVRSSLWIVLACYWGAGLGLAIVVIEFSGRDAETSVGIVAVAMLMSFLTIVIKLYSKLRQWKADQSRTQS